MCHRSGPVELCEKMLELIKCATGPDLWNYVKKMCSGPEYVKKMQENVPQVRTCGIM